VLLVTLIWEIQKKMYENISTMQAKEAAKAALMSAKSKMEPEQNKPKASSTTDLEAAGDREGRTRK
jgi:hypothetical protein